MSNFQDMSNRELLEALINRREEGVKTQPKKFTRAQATSPQSAISRESASRKRTKAWSYGPMTEFDETLPPSSIEGFEDFFAEVTRKSAQQTKKNPKQKCKEQKPVAEKFPKHELDDEHVEPLSGALKPARRALQNVPFLGTDEDKQTVTATKLISKSKSSTKAPVKPQETTADVENSTSAQPAPKRKRISVRVPSSLEEASPADQEMYRMKAAGHSWSEIRQRYMEITGIEPGSSTLSVRYSKMKELLEQNGNGDDSLLIQFKREVEKELGGELWVRVAEKMSQEKATPYDASVVRKRIMALEKHGWSVEDQEQGQNNDKEERAQTKDKLEHEEDTEAAGSVLDEDGPKSSDSIEAGYDDYASAFPHGLDAKYFSD